jgi:hypothetical protein
LAGGSLRSTRASVKWVSPGTGRMLIEIRSNLVPEVQYCLACLLVANLPYFQRKLNWWIWFLISVLWTTDYGHESRTGPLPCFASTNSWFVTKWSPEGGTLCNSGIYLKHKNLISSSSFTTSQNDTTCQSNVKLILLPNRIL